MEKHLFHAFLSLSWDTWARLIDSELLVIHCHLVVSLAGRRLILIAGTLWEYVALHHQVWTSQFLASSSITPALSLNSRFCCPFLGILQEC